MVHERMPVILDANSYDLWLDPGMTNVNTARDLLKPFPRSGSESWHFRPRPSQLGEVLALILYTPRVPWFAPSLVPSHT
jgi:putative SOS response-associated peptidase YedK